MQTIEQLADKLGIIAAQLATLQAEYDARKAELIAAGVDVVEGALFRATVSHVEPAPRIDWKAIAERLEPSRQLITAHTIPAAPYYRVAVKARAGVAA